jgi:hypothetical protein
MLLLGACGTNPSVPSTNSTSEDGESTTEDGEGEASSETETGEPLPECAWEAVTEAECSLPADPPVLAPDGVNDQYFEPSVAVGPDGTVHVLNTKEQTVPNLGTQRILGYYSNATGAWVEQEFVGDFFPWYPKIQVSEANVIRASAGIYLRNDSGTFVRPAPFDGVAGDESLELATARELDLAYLLTFAGDLGSFSVWSEEQGCVRRLWTLPQCEPSLQYTRIAVRPNGGLPVVMAEVEDQLALTNFAEPIPQIQLVGNSPVGLLGDVEIDETGRIHACFWRSPEIGIVWATGLGVDDWQERVVPDTADVALDGFRCQLAVTADGADVWMTNPSSGLGVRHMHADVYDFENVLPLGPIGYLWDIALGPDEQPAVVGVHFTPPGATWFVARRVGEGEWDSEVIAYEEIPP